MYLLKKAKLRQEAIEWQYSIEYISLDEIISKQAYFEKMGKRYGLIKEFRENGII